MRHTKPKNTKNDWIQKLKLHPHPEGGYFRETYRSKETINSRALPVRFRSTKKRALSTAIYFLITKGNPSRPHRIQSDEMWHFYRGGVLRLHMKSPRGKKISVVMSTSQTLQAVVPAGWWMSAEVIQGSYVLVGCTVAPGFEFSDLEMKA